MAILRDPTQRDLENCLAPAEYEDLQRLTQVARQMGAVVTVHELPPTKEKVECSGDCRTCDYADDCDTLYQKTLGEMGFT